VKLQQELVFVKNAQITKCLGVGTVHTAQTVLDLARGGGKPHWNGCTPTLYSCNVQFQRGGAKPMAKAAKRIVLWAWGRARALQDCNRRSASALSLLRRGRRGEVARGSDRRGCLIDVAQSRCGSENAQRGSWVKGWPIESKTWLIRDWLSDKWLVQSLSRHEVSTE